MANQKSLPSRLLVLALLFFLPIAVYWNGLSGRFFFDDFANIISIPAIRIKQISFDSILDVWASGIAGPLGRPLPMLTFAANHYFFGSDPYWFKLTNVLIHCVNGILVYFFALLIMRAMGPRSTSQSGSNMDWVAAAVAFAWVLQPIQLTSVLYVVQRMTSLSATFVLGALILHIWARQRLCFGWKESLSIVVAWCVLLPLALLCKETAALFLLYVAVYEAVMQRQLSGRFDRMAIGYFTLLFIGVVVFIFGPSWVPGPNLADLMGGYEDRDFNLEQRVLTEGRIIMAYVKMILVPVLSDFSLYHDDFPLSRGLLEPVATFLSLLVLAFALVLALLLRKKVPLFSFGVLWFLVGHSLESTIFPLELMHEHRNYLPVFGLLVMLVPVFDAAMKARREIAVLAGGGFIALFAYWVLITHLRVDMYGDELRRTQVEAQYRPGSVRTQYQAGAFLVDAYNLYREPVMVSMAERHFERVNALDSRYKLALVGMLQLDCLSEQTARVEILDELHRRLANESWTSRERLVMHGIAEMSNAGTLCLTREQADRLFAAVVTRQDISARDRSVVLSDYVLYLWIGQNDHLAALAVLKQTVSEDPDNILNKLNLVQLLRFLGERDQLLDVLAGLQSRELGRRDRISVEKIVSELAEEGVNQRGIK